MFKFIALCLLVVFARGQFGSYTSTKINSVDVAIGYAAGNGYKVFIGAPGYLYTAAIPGLIKPSTTTAAAVSGTFYTTVTGTTGTGAVVGVGLVTTPGTGSCTTSTLVSEHGAATLQGGSAGPTCLSDFLTVYSAAPASSPASTSFYEIGPSRMSVISATSAMGYQWVFTNPSDTTGSCVQLAITPYTINAAGTSTAGAAFPVANSGNTCNASGTTNFNAGGKLTVATSNNPQYSFYVELQGTGTTAAVCFQTQAQWTLAPGNCFASIVSGVLASIGLVVAVFFN